MLGQHRKKLLLLAALSVASLLIAGSVPTAYADHGGWHVPGSSIVKAIGNVIGGVAFGSVLLPLAAVIYAIGFIGSVLIWIAGWFVDWAVALNNNILAAENAVVHVGWRVSRDLANLGFVLAIIFIAFLTILRAAGYNTKQMLTRLIIAALLVNFSLVIAGVIIDFAGVISSLFLDKINPRGAAAFGLSTQITAGFAPQKFLELNKAEGWLATLTAIGTFTGQLKLLLGVSFATFLTFIVALALLTISAMFLARYIVLSLLLAIAPIAWLLWIWPSLEQHWKAWWSEFMRWVFFMPAATFFLYLALMIALNRNQYLGRLAAQVAASGTGPQNLSSVADLFAQFGQAAAVIGLAIGGLMLSYKVGGFASQAAAMTGGWVAAKGKSIGKGAGKGFAKTGSGWYAQKLAGVGANAGTARRVITAPLRGVGKGLMGLGVGAGAPIAAGSIWHATVQGVKGGFLKKKMKDWKCKADGYTVTAVHPPAACPDPAHPAGAPSLFVPA